MNATPYFVEAFSVRLGPGRQFGIFYLAVWSAAFVALLYFMVDIPRYLSLAAGLALAFLAPDIATLRSLLSGKEDEN